MAIRQPILPVRVNPRGTSRVRAKILHQVREKETRALEVPETVLQIKMMAIQAKNSRAEDENPEKAGKKSMKSSTTRNI